VTKEQTVTIDGKSYDLGKLSENAKAQLASIQAVDVELQRLEQQKAFAQTARNAYFRELQGELSKVEPLQ
jgi:hypothetical protein